MKLQYKVFTFFTLFSILLFSTSCSNFNNQAKAVPQIDSLVSAEWLIEHLNDADLVVLDSSVIVELDGKGGFKSISGRANYNAGHIPTAGFADLMGDFSKETSLKFVMPTAEQFSAAMGALGVDNNSRVVIYSAENEVWAARLWWMLRWAGFDQVALLDGGLKAWKAAGGEISTEASNRPQRKFTMAVREEVIASRDEVFAAIDNDQVKIIDSLPEAHYRGDFALYSRPGHIPSATNMPTSDLIDSGLYKEMDELEMMFDSDRNNRVITYCGGGVAASSLAFVMHRMGYKDVSVYMGSLQEWTADPENPMTVDVTTEIK